MRTLIESLGLYLPKRVVTSREVIDGCARFVGFPLEQYTGISARHVAADGEYSFELTLRAIERCVELSKSGLDGVDLVICGSCSRMEGPKAELSFEPSMAARVVDHFGLHPALAFDVSNACAGLWSALQVADALLRSGLARRALVASGEYITHLTRTAQLEIEGMMDPRVPCLTLGDSGAALLMAAGEQDAGLEFVDLRTLGRYSDYCVAGPTQQPHGGAIMHTDMIRLGAVGVKEAVEHMLRMMDKHALDPDAFEHIIPHQSSTVSLQDAGRTLRERLGPRADDLGARIVNNLARRANTATTSTLLAAWDCMKNGRVRAGERALFGITGSGLTVGAALYKFDDLPERVRSASDDPAPTVAQRRRSGELQASADAAIAEMAQMTEPRRCSGASGARVDAASAGLTQTVAQRSGRAELQACVEVVSAEPATTAAQRICRAEPKARVLALPQRVAIAGVGSCVPDGRERLDTKQLLSAAAERCLGRVSTDRSEVELLIHVGVHRSGFVVEPSVGALMAGELRLNETSRCEAATFAFDLNAGGIGFLAACAVVASMLEARGLRTALILASEYANDSARQLVEAATAVLVDASSCKLGIEAIAFAQLPGTTRSLTVSSAQEQGPTFLRVTRSAALDHEMLACARAAVTALLEHDGLSLDDIGHVLVPAATPDFRQRLAQALHLPAQKLARTELNGDTITSSSQLGLAVLASQHQHKPCLIVEVAAGVQAACALVRERNVIV